MITVTHKGNLAIINNKSIPNETAKNSMLQCFKHRFLSLSDNKAVIFSHIKMIQAADMPQRLRAPAAPVQSFSSQY